MLEELVWRDYHKGRLIADHASGFSVIVPKGLAQSATSSCPVCNHLFRSSDDLNTYLRFKCCSWCADVWAYARAEEWDQGWRPTVEEVQSRLASRAKINVHVDIR